MDQVLKKTNNSEASKADSLDSKKSAESVLKEQTNKPDVFRYHQYLEFLKDWFAFQKKNKKGFSLRKVAAMQGLATGYLSMVLSGQRPLSNEALHKLMPIFQFNKSEQQFFLSMHTLGVTNLQEERIEALGRMKKYRNYRKNNPQEAEAYEYLTQWYYYTIRELSADPEFKLDPLWIQGRLRVHVPLHEIKGAIDFLLANQYLEVNKSDGKVLPPRKHIQCEGGIYRIALTQYHKQLFHLAEKSIEYATPSERHIVGHTFSMPLSKYQQVRDILEKAFEQVQQLTEKNSGESSEAVYHLEMALFPLTKNKNGSQV